MSSYRLTSSAFADLQSIARYLRKKASDRVAAKVVARILSVCDELSVLQSLGHKRPALTSKPVMFYAVWSYLVVFTRDADTLTVHAVLHGARNLPAVLRTRL